MLRIATTRTVVREYVETGARRYHPGDADFIELPHADELSNALAPLVAACADESSPDAPRSRRAAEHANRVVGRHVSKLCGVAKSFESPRARDPARRSRLCESVRGRESLDFAALVERELGDDSLKRESMDARSSVEFARGTIRAGFVDDSDGRQSADWARRSTKLELRASLARDPLRRGFFERLAESQAYAVYRENFPGAAPRRASPVAVR